MYNLQTLREKVKNRLADPNFADELINDFLNDEQREIFNYYNLPFNRAKVPATISEGGNTIALPLEHQRTTGLRIVAPEGYDVELTQWFMPYNRFKDYFREAEYYSKTVPRWWTIYDNEIVFAYQADKAYQLEHDFLTAVEDMTVDTSEPAIPQEFQEVLVLGALVRCLEVNDDNDIAQYQQGKKNLLLQGLISRYTPGRQSGKTTVLRNTNRGI